MKKTSLTIQIDNNLKKQAIEIFKEMGMSMTTAVTLFLKQCVQDKELPFEVNLPFNQTTIDAFNELPAMMSDRKQYKDYNDLREILAELDEEKA